MAWPPPALPVNRSDALYQQTNHAKDHNDANQAINDIVAQVVTLLNRTTPTFVEQTTGATGPILAGSTYQPFNLNIPAVGWNRIVVVQFQYYMAVGAGGSASVALRHGVTNAVLSSVVKRDGNGSVAGSFVTNVAAGTAFPFNVLITATTTDTNVFADAASNRISAVGLPG